MIPKEFQTRRRWALLFDDTYQDRDWRPLDARDVIEDCVRPYGFIPQFNADCQMIGMYSYHLNILLLLSFL